MLLRLPVYLCVPLPLVTVHIRCFVDITYKICFLLLNRLLDHDFLPQLMVNILSADWQVNWKKRLCQNLKANRIPLIYAGKSFFSVFPLQKRKKQTCRQKHDYFFLYKFWWRKLRFWFTKSGPFLLPKKKKAKPWLV